MSKKKSVVINEILPFRVAKDAFEREYLNLILTETQGNMSAAAVRADKDRKNFYQMVEKHGIDHQSYRIGTPEESE